MLVAAPPLLGQHLLIDGVTGNTLTVRAAKVFLADIARFLEMQMVGQPEAYQQGKAVVAFVVIAESHISLHLYPAPAVSYLDIFSCKAFDRENAVTFISQYLQMTDMVSQQIDRGRTNEKGYYD